jgi:hypothetical protein
VSVETKQGEMSCMRDNVSRIRRRGRRLSGLILAACTAVAVLAVGPSSASAEFGFEKTGVTFTNEDGSPATQAGSHPFAVTTTTVINSHEIPSTTPFPAFAADESVRNLFVEQAPGLIGSAIAAPDCTVSDFAASIPGTASPECPDRTAVGVAAVNVIGPYAFFNVPVYSLEPPPGVPVMIGFSVLNVRATVELGVEPNGNVIAKTVNFPQSLRIFGATLQLWGNPTDPAHDTVRGHCVGDGFSAFSLNEVNFAAGSTGACPVEPGPAFITLPRSCTGPVTTHYAMDSWPNPGVFVKEDAVTPGMTGCEHLAFKPTVEATPTTGQAETPSGLDFTLAISDEGLTAREGLAQSDFKKATVRLPEGMTINPSIGEGLGVCTPADYAGETLESEPGAGCPNASKLGTVEVESQLIDETIKGSLFQAQQDDPATTQPGAENPFDSLLAMYIVFKNPKLGIIVKQPAKIEADARTGQLTTVVDNIPQVPFSQFHLHFREGGRSPLATPATCGTYTAEADLVPWSNPGKVVTATSSFKVTSGVGGGPCPSGGTPPFHPGLDAGTLNNAAGSYSPFNLRLTRNDGEQEFTNFSIKLPPGIVGKLAGIPFCPDASIEAAKSRTGTQEEQSPSCPKASEVGRTLVGAGVGPALTYAPGKVYLAGPYNGSSLSIAAITAGVVGPFDVGTVVVREALKINPETAEVFIDATGSDPIPHIIDGIVVHARDIRVYVDRPEFVLNPTNCERTSTASTVLGSGLDFASSADDNPITVTSPFQAASCASLGFKPKLALSLKGGTKRGQNPAFKAVLTARKGDANIGAAQVTLPHSEFLDQSHIKTVCTRVQFKEGAFPGEKCPAASVYGYATAITPLLDEPIQGPVFLRSSSHNLPDLVAALHSGKIDVNLTGRIDSVKGGRIRNTFEEVPDAPVTKFTLTMQGGKKGLLVNSTNLCKSTNRAISHFTGQNGKVSDTNPVLKPQCKKAKKAKGKQKRAAKRSAR